MARGGPRPGAGRPPGQPNQDTAERRAALADLMAGHVEDAIAALAEIATGGQSEAARISAATAILDRTYGRPSQAMDLSAHVDMPNRIIITDTVSADALDLSRLSTSALEEIAALQDACEPSLTRARENS